MAKITASNFLEEMLNDFFTTTYIESQTQKPTDLITAKLQFLRDLHKKLGEQKIDVVLRRADSTVDLPVYRIAKQTGVLLQ